MEEGSEAARVGPLGLQEAADPDRTKASVVANRGWDARNKLTPRPV